MHIHSMKWIVYGEPKETIEDYKFNFYENKNGEFFLVIWRKPHFRRTVHLGHHLQSNILEKIMNEDIPPKIAALIAKESIKYLKKWI